MITEAAIGSADGTNLPLCGRITQHEGVPTGSSLIGPGNADTQDKRGEGSEATAATKTIFQGSYPEETSRTEGGSEAGMTAEQREMLKTQRDEFLAQSDFLLNAVEEHLSLTGKHVLEEDKSAAVDPEKAAVGADVALAAASGAGAVAPDTTPAAKTTRLNPEAEQALLAFFALQDTLSKEAASVLAARVGCEEGQAREYCTKMRGTLRAFLERMQRKSTAHAPEGHGKQGAPESTAASVAQAASEEAVTPLDHGVRLEEAATGGASSNSGQSAPSVAKEAGVTPVSSAALHLERQGRLDLLHNLLDAQGGISHVDFVASMMGLMAAEKSWEARSQMLKALVATNRPAILTKLCTLAPFIPLLEGWLKAADLDRQTSFLRHLLAVLGRLPLAPTLIGMSGLAKAVARLEKYRLAAVANAATVLLEQWQHSPDVAGTQAATQLASNPIPGGAAAEGGGARSARSRVDPLAEAAPLLRGNGGDRPKIDGAASLAAAQAAGFTRGFIPRQGSGGNQSTKPLTADEIIRAKAKKRPGGASSYLDFGAHKTPRSSGPGAMPPLLPGQATQLQRQQQQQAHTPLQGPAVTMEQRMRHAGVTRDRHREQLQAARRTRLKAEVAMSDASRRLAEQMGPTCEAVWPAPRQPPWDPEVTPDDPPIPGAGEDSKERIILPARDARQPAAYYTTYTSIPPSPGEAAAIDAAPPTGHKVPIIPWEPADPHDAAQQNDKLLTAGILLPGFVRAA